MYRRKWFVRCLVLTVATGCVAAGVLYTRWTDPVVVRARVLDQLRKQFPGAEVTLEAAHLRILGGIQVRNLLLARKDDPEALARIPSALVYHDKEKLLDGELNFRKVELLRPHLRAVRRPDGSWNLQGIAGLMSPDRPWPTLVIQQGTLSFQDLAQDGTGMAFEVTDVHLVCRNDPLTVVDIKGSAKSTIMGTIDIEGSWHRDTRACRFTLKAAGLPLGADWTKRIVCPAAGEHLAGLEVGGEAGLQVEVAYEPGSANPLTYEARMEVRKGSLRSPILPLDLDDIHATLHVAGEELRVEEFRARAGAAALTGTAWANLTAPDRNFGTQLRMTGLPLTEALARKLPEKFRKLQAMFAPVGTADVHFDLLRTDGEWKVLPDGRPSQARLVPTETQVTFDRFPLPLRKVVGTIVYDLTRNRTEMNVRGLAADRPVTVKGHWEGKGEDVDARFDIAADDLALEDALLRALPDHLEKRARGFRARGKVDVRATLAHLPGWENFRNEFRLKFHDVALDWTEFPYPLEDVSGNLDIFPDRWECSGFRGRHGKGIVNAACRSRPDRESKGLTIELSGRGILLDQDLLGALASKPALLKAWKMLRPTGRFDFAAVIDRPEDPRPMDVRMDVQGGTYLPTFFACPLELVTGQVRSHGSRLELTGFRARRGEADFHLGRADMVVEGDGFHADLKDLHVRKLTLDEPTVEALPGALKDLARSLHLQGPVNIKSRLVVSQANSGTRPDCFWDAQAWFSNSAFEAGLPFRKVRGTLACLGRHDGQRFLGMQGNLLFDGVEILGLPSEGFHAHFKVEPKSPDALLMNLKAPLFGGDVSGQVRLDFHSSLGYELNLTASQIDLARFGKHSLGPKNQLAGILVGRLHLTGKGKDLANLEGNGSLDIPFGRILNLPLLLDLLKFLGLRWPDRTAFEELHAAFGIQGRRVQMRNLELLGNAVSLTGQGEFNLDGSDLNLDFYPRWARVEQMLPPAVRPLPPALTKNLLTIQVRGKVGSGPDDLKFLKKPIPILLDPLLEMRDWMRGNPSPRGKTPAISDRTNATPPREIPSLRGREGFDDR